RVESVPWSELDRVADLGSGTGRTAAWLRSKGVGLLHGVDVTPEVVEIARARRLHDALVLADVRSTPFRDASFAAVVCSLVDEHLPSLTELYDEAGRVLRRDGHFVVVGYHPFFIMASGMPTHFDRPDGTAIAIETHVHLASEHFAAARAAGLAAAELY